jgi:hypothetical protein
MARKIFYWILALVPALFIVSGCSTPAANEVGLGSDFTLSIGQSTSIPVEGLKFKFSEVVTDSRCPTGVECFWQGEVTCLVEITYSNSINSMVLTQSGGDPSRDEFNNYAITFSVDPYPVAGKSIKQSDYRLHLNVQKKQALSGGILATFDVVGEKYSIFITNQNTIREVLAVQSGTSKATIPSGLLVAGAVFYNPPWSWHIDSEDIQMAEITMELCDGTPSTVEKNLDYWLQTVKRFCPWSAKLVSIDDFR